MNVLVNGIGNIGQTVLSFLIRYKELLDIDTIYAFKNTPQHFEDYSCWTDKGVKLYFDKSKLPIANIHFAFDCTSNGIAKANKEWYETFPNLMGANAQGTEHYFGQSIMLGLNHNSAAEHKYQHIVSCNTHGILSLLKYFSSDLNNIKNGDFVVVRRSEDLGNHERLVSANVVARHRDEDLGTHHAIDATALLQTMGVNIPLCSSDITTPSQLMHSVRFNIELHNAEKTKSYPYTATTNSFDSNKIFELGRRHGFQGRIFNHSIIVENNILETDNSVKGWAFIPQEGNTILSTIASYSYRCFDNNKANMIMKSIVDNVFCIRF